MNFKPPLFAVAMFLLSTTINAQKSLWKKSNSNGKLNKISLKEMNQNESKIFILSDNDFRNQLIGAPLRGSANRVSDNYITVPDEKGNMLRFQIFEAPVFSPSLSAKYPNIKSYVGHAEGAMLRMSVSPKGVQTMITYQNKPATFMQPIKGESDKYIVYNKDSKQGLETDTFICSTADEIKKENPTNTSTARDANDQTLRKFRFAISVNGEYTTYHGGTVADALAAVNATMARVNAVFEVDMAVTFEVQDFPQLIYTNAATDPYSPNLGAWNVELQNTLTSVIGNAAYDIGHMFGASGGGGNAGCIGCVCVDDTASTTDTEKGSGITSPADGIPEGDNFDIDYVAHEIGHQMGANHTFSHNTEGTGVNVEPGSGSTIMGYAGITSSNVQQHSDAYFHYVSIKQILDNLDIRTCWQANSPVTLTNNPPVANAGSDYTIPQGTAYVLRGGATDADGGDVLSYCWEQNDSGQTTRTQFGPTRTSGAQVRSLLPSASPDRYVPKLSRIVAGQLTETNPNNGDDWETVSTVGRTLNFALTVRDRAPSATGLNGQSSFDLMAITVDAASGPFTVTAPNTGVAWDVGSTQTVTWDVANTNSASGPNCQNVNIKLSIDGGVTFPITLASNTPNDGSHDIVLPNNPGTQNRIMVEAADNIFLAVNSTNFTINSTTPTFIATNVTGDISVCNSGGNTATFDITLDFVNGFSETVSLSSTGEPAGSTVTFTPTSLNADGTVTMVVSNLDGVTAQSYTINVTASSTSVTRNLDAVLNVYSSTFASVNLTAPTDGATGVSLTPVLTWDAISNATSYDVEVATDSGFTSIISSGNVTSNSYTIGSSLSLTTVYYWRVKAKNLCGDGGFSAANSFTTQSCSVCTSVANTSYDTSTTRVIFNTIDNSSAKENGGFSDFTSISTDVKENEVHDLTVHANTDGDYTTHTIVWIDWNQDCDFDDANEQYDLGTADNVADGATTSSPFSVTVPVGAALGTTIMRVATKYSSDPTSCENGADAEVEDYTINVVDATASIKDVAFEGFNLYPNPSNGNITLTFDTIASDEVQLQLFDLTGRLVQKLTYTNVSARFAKNISFDSASNGLYLLKVSNGNRQVTRKLIIE
jgi:hypothetical protein